MTHDVTIWLLQQADTVEANLTSRGSHKYSPRDEPLLEGVDTWRPERQERRQPSRQLPQQSHSRGRSSAPRRGPNSTAEPSAAGSSRNTGIRRTDTHVSGASYAMSHSSAFWPWRGIITTVAMNSMATFCSDEIQRNNCTAPLLWQFKSNFR
jgi:hypothetical protein